MPGIPMVLRRAALGWEIIKGSGKKEIYNDLGRLVQINDHGKYTALNYRDDGRLREVIGQFRQTLSFSYDNTTGKLATLTDPEDLVTAYSYDTNGVLEKVTHPDLTSRIYRYENPARTNLLTGIIDENGVRYATFDYNPYGKVILSEHAGGYDRVTLSYNADGTTVTDAAGTSWDYSFTQDSGRHKPTSKTQNGKTIHNAYDNRKRLIAGC